MDKYLKINDFFVEKPKQRAINKKLIDCQGASIASCIDETVAEFITHALVSHDELVAEVERLRGVLAAVGSVLNEVDRVISERIKNGAYDLDDISAEVSQAIERLDRDTELMLT